MTDLPGPAVPPLLSIEGLEVRHDGVPALRELSLEVMPGQALALLGANGAGKTTLLRAVIGLARARRGRILLDGRPIGHLPPHRRARLGIGFCPEGRHVFSALSVRENLAVACWAGAAERERRLDAMLALFPALAEHHARPAWSLSGGQQQMLAIGRALIDRPRLLLLDEPSLGLAPRIAEELFALLARIAAGGTAIVLAEQNAARALAVCEAGVVLRGGRVVARGAAAALAGAAVRAALMGG